MLLLVAIFYYLTFGGVIENPWESYWTLVVYGAGATVTGLLWLWHKQAHTADAFKRATLG